MVVGLVVVGYAVVQLLGGPTRRSSRKMPVKVEDASTHADEAQPERDKRVAAKKKKPIIAKAEETEPSNAPRELTLEKAREEFDAFIKELDREIAKVDGGSARLNEEAWKAYRLRGSIAIDRILKKMDHKDPVTFAEIQEKQDLAARRLAELHPDGAPPF